MTIHFIECPRDFRGVKREFYRLGQAIPHTRGDETVDIMTFIMKCITTEKNGTVKPYKVIPDGATLYKGSDFEGPKVIDPVIRDFMKSQLGLSDARIDNIRR